MSALILLAHSNPFSVLNSYNFTLYMYTFSANSVQKPRSRLKKRSLITLNMYVRVYAKVFNWNFYCHLSQGDKQESRIRVPMFAHPRHVLVNYLHIALHMYM